MTREDLVFVGTIICCNSMNQLSIFKGFLTVENGKITRKGSLDEFSKLKNAATFSGFEFILLKDDQFLIPGFVDCHTHAPQFPNLGLGLDLPLLEWLAKYTFPLEKKYSDLEFASQVYDKVVKRLIQNGTTTACYFGSIHLEGTLQLVRSVIKYHQRAIVGKVSMNIKNSEGYYTCTAKDLKEVETFVKGVLEHKNDLVLPVVTPRFAVSCDTELMTSLAEIAKKYNCRIQSHISENLDEIDYVLSQNPDCKCYAEVYDKCNILTEKCIMAHAVHLSEAEMELLSKRGVSVAHCPASNTRLKSGICPVRKLIDHDIVVGLGTDVSGGDSATILDAMRRTMDISTFVDPDMQQVTWTEAFYLATLGGAKALNLDDRIGSLEVGKEFDALLIEVYVNGGPITRYEGFPDHKQHQQEYAEALLQRFIYAGDDRNIVQVYVKGKKVKDVSSHKILHV